MSKQKYYEGDRDTLLVEENGKIYPFLLAARKNKRLEAGQENYKFMFGQEIMVDYMDITWEKARADGEIFKEIP